MAQLRRSEFDFADDRPLAPRDLARVMAATGDEAPVASPALELQRALDEMFTAAPVSHTDYVRGIALTAATFGTLAACSAFWWATIHWAVSHIA
jgi:hypothetical protein